MNIYQKLVEVRKCVPYLQKEKQGQQYQYVGSSQVLASVRAKMDELQLLLIPAVIDKRVSVDTIEYQDKDRYGNVKPKRTSTYFTELDMTFTWVNAENPEETITSQWYGQGIDTAGEKGVGKAMTYAEKYFLLKFFNIATDKDDPDNFQGDKPDNKQQSQQQQKPQQSAQQYPKTKDQHAEYNDKLKRLKHLAKQNAGVEDTTGWENFCQNNAGKSCSKLTIQDVDKLLSQLEKQSA